MDKARTKGAARTLLRRYDALLGPAAAGLLGLATAFFCYAMPADLMDALHVPAALSGSRLFLALGLGLLVGALTWAGFAWLDRAARPVAHAIGAPEGEAADLPPVLRRADAHPDAPPRRPIFAGSDLGTPLDLIDPLPADWSESDVPPTPYPAPFSSFQTDGAPQVEEGALVDVVPVEQERPIVAPPPRPAPLSISTEVPLSAMMSRLEAGLARKALALAGAEANVTPLKREIRPVRGSLTDAVDAIQQRTAARR